MKKICTAFLFLALFSMAYPQENIAPAASQILTSYVSSWEDLYAINNGIEPGSSDDKTGGAYGNWSGTDNLWQWVEYDWDKYYLLNRSEIYWWVDGQGIKLPYDTYIEYWDFQKDDWTAFTDPEGNGTEINTYNVTTFKPVLTKKIRVHMISTIATGILEWKVFGTEGEQVPETSYYETDKVPARGETCNLTLHALDRTGNPVKDYIFKFNLYLKNELPDTEESYSINGQQYTSDQSEISLPASSASGISTLSLEIPATIDPMDGFRIELLFNDAYTRLGDEISFYEAGLIPPVLSADDTENNTDYELELPFSDDSDWRNALKTVSADGFLLQAGSDFDLLPGVLVLKPVAGNPGLCSTGTKTITVEARGYENTATEQEILPGKINIDSTRIYTAYKLYSPVTTKIIVDVRDSFNNPVPGVRLYYAATITNNDAGSDEIYKLNGTEYTGSVSGLLSPLSDSDGRIELPFSLPYGIDKNDGISVGFETTDGSVLTQDIHYFNDGTDKELVVQNAVRTNAGFSWDRTAQSDDFIVYWGEKISGDPTDPVNGSLVFDPQEVMATLSSILSFIVDSLDFIANPDELNMARYKHEVVMNETWVSGFTGWAFGGSADNKIGGMWIHPQATAGGGVLSHEFTHMCQSMILLQYPGYGLNASYAGFFWESHANFMMKNYVGNYLGVQPERYIWTAMQQYSTTRRHYQNIYFLDYLVDKYGMETVHDIWRKASPTKSHPLTALRDSVLRYTQDDLNDDFGYHAMKNATWDYSGGSKIRSAIAAVDPMYIQRQYTVPDTVSGENGLYIVPEYLAPGDYGYNIIPLYPDETGSIITLDFAGLENASAGGAGWRYAFVAVNNEGNPRYSELYRDPDGQAQFSIQSSDSMIFLVVTGAPDNHHNYSWEPGYPKVFRYPYTFRLQGALPAGYYSGYNNLHQGLAGAPHQNGGGWVASTASVAESAFVGPDAQVLGTARVSDYARIEDFAIITDNSTVMNSAIVRDQAIVGRGASVRNNALVEKSARVYGSSVIRDSAVVSGAALLYRTNLSGRAIVRDLAILMDVSLSGTTIIGGDAEEYNGCTAGTYLQFSRHEACDGKINHVLNVEVNPLWDVYFYPLGERPATPLNINGAALNDQQILLTWDEANDLQEVLAYYIYRDGELIKTVYSNSVIISGLSPASSYSFALRTLDRSGNTSQLSEIIDVSTSPENIEKEKEEVLVFPNPARKKITLRSPFEGTSSVCIYDLNGKQVFSTEFENVTEILLPRQAGKGTFILFLEGNGQYRTEKVVFE